MLSISFLERKTGFIHTATKRYVVQLMEAPNFGQKKYDKSRLRMSNNDSVFFCKKKFIENSVHLFIGK
jgi:hypothetical protein